MELSVAEKDFLLKYLSKTNNALIEHKAYTPVAILLDQRMIGFNLGGFELMDPMHWAMFIEINALLNYGGEIRNERQLKWVLLSFQVDGFFGKIMDFGSKEGLKKTIEAKKAIFCTLYATKEGTATILQEYTKIGDNLYMIEKTWPEIEKDIKDPGLLLTSWGKDIFPKSFK